MSRINRGAFHHIDLNVSDLAASKRVYGPVLEFLGYRPVKDEEGCEWDLSDDGRGSSLGLRLCDPALRNHAIGAMLPGSTTFPGAPTAVRTSTGSTRCCWSMASRCSIRRRIIRNIRAIIMRFSSRIRTG